MANISFSQTKLNQFLKPSDTLNTSRRNAVVITEASMATLTLVGLNQLWYADYPKSKFHTLNDNNQWLQMDKLGHVFSAYQLGRLGANTLHWSGVSKQDQLIYGSTIGVAFLTVVEVFDGYSEEWGFSWGDMAANVTGAGLYVGQELLWKEQRFTIKYSFHRTDYAPQNPEVLGNGFSEEFLKDYNGQTYWLSLNLHAFFKESKIPSWLNVALGYGAEGMISGSNTNDNDVVQEQNPYRQFYLSLDLDLTRIKTNSHVLRTIFDVFNVIKVPFPALEFNDKNGIKFHGIYF
ncbi:MAG: DUF2279 domain-containing protein [Xanthomarina sp.]|uniref:DUF2279 domain-containing protein n=1 Tax=Xanthomarina sp. TaxID=1931211 RepID=UPI000C53A8BF|nr:DUF2279 domain-containing protein [Xanthomarina sp.]MAL24214.1 DUF2279 domain-containing protein [Xanthomarina sp.]MBF62277.1 DUF2279 domain-containing protein [Xanthomarina sp.]HAI19555.1 DUF2279 domain-containing protein [Xanthomarina gelatinilytica]